MSVRQRIVITGRGLVGPTGCGLQTLAANGSSKADDSALGTAGALFDGRSNEPEGTGHFDAGGYDVSELGATWVGAARGFDAVSMLGEQGNVRLLDRASAMLVRATGEALEESGYDAKRREREEVGLVLGTTFCSAHTIAAFDRRAVSAGPRYASPLDFANTVINAATGQAAIWFNLRGLNSTVAGESASSLEALGYALRALHAGRAQALLVGGVEELSLELLLGLQRLGLLHQGNGTAPEPFAAGRSGFAPSEGAAVVMLETLDRAQKRGATIYGELLGAGAGFDPSFIPELAMNDVSAASSVPALGGAVTTALSQAELGADALDLLVAGANGSPRGDRCEAELFGREFEASSPPVVAPKARFGEPLGAGGVMQLLAGLAVLDGAPPPIASRASADGLGDWYPGAVLQQPLAPRQEVRRALLSTVGWAGHTAAVVVGDARDLR